VRGYPTEHLLHAWAKHANHHLLEHAQEGRMMLSHHSFRSIAKSLQNLFSLEKMRRQIPSATEPWAFQI
jgi:hypothetical protein